MEKKQTDRTASPLAGRDFSDEKNKKPAPAGNVNNFRTENTDKPVTDKTGSLQQKKAPDRNPGVKKEKKRRRDKKLRLLAMVSLLCVIVTGLFVFLIVRFLRPSSEPVDRKAYFGLKDGVSYGLIINDERVESFPVKHAGFWYLDYETVYACVSSKFFYDGMVLLYTDPLTTWSAVPGKAYYYDSNGGKYQTEYEPAFFSHGRLYISLDYIQLMDYSYFRVDTAMMYAWVYNDWEKKESAATLSGTILRNGADRKETVIRSLKEGERVIILSEGKKWAVVQADTDGLIGYVPKNRLSDKEEYARPIPDNRSLPVYTTHQMDETVCLAWHQVFTESGIDKLDDLIKHTDGLNVISPTWIVVKNEQGDIQSVADEKYVRKAHQKGIRIWVMLQNIDIDVDEGQLLGDTRHRRHLIEETVNEVNRVGADGINLDFEAVGSQNGDLLLQFIRELSAACRVEGLTLSVDNYSPMPHTAYYDRKQQAEMVDYIIVMAYDEHYAGDETAGSTSSIEWVKRSAERTLEEVPASKLVVGLPFYARLWKETPAQYALEGEKIYQDEDSIYGSYTLSSRAIGMTGCRNVVEEKDLAMAWLDTEQQYYVEYTEENSTYRLWIEDIRSMKAKLETVFSYEPAGVAFFSLGLETDNVWSIIKPFLEGS